MAKSGAYLLAAALIVAVCSSAGARPKTDVVKLANGDRITCEIKKLSRGKLEASTDSMDKLYIEWADIVALSSPAYFHVTDSNGRFYFGSIEMPDTAQVLRVVSVSAIVALPALSVVSIAPIEKSFMSRNHGSVKIGFDYSKSTDLMEIYFDLSNRYRGARTIVDVAVTATVTDQGGEDGTKRRGDVGGNYYYMLHQRFTASVGAKLERNDELDVKRRILGNVAAGYNLVATNESVLLLAGGLAVNSERSYSSDETNASLEGVLHAGYSIFQYNFPVTGLDTVLDVYPSITEHGRVRVEFSIDLQRELIDDLFFDLEFYDSYDNKPPSGGESTSDYGIKTSLGYSWG